MSDTRRHTTRVDEPTAEQARPWWHTDVEGRPVTFWMVVGTLIAAVTLGVGAFWTYGLDRDQQAQAMGGDGAMSGGGMDAMSPDAPRVPAVFGYVDGEAIAFMHTEASDLTVAQMLEGMMGSPVPVVQSLADVPASATASVIVFTNGIVPADTPAGPFGFQPDVFDAPPGDPGYTPLRRVVTATWTDESSAELLTSLHDVRAAVDAGAVRLDDTGVVVNIPFLTWPDGQR